MAPGCTMGKRTEDPFWPFMLLLNSLFLWQYIPSTVQHLYSYGQAKCGARGKGCLMAKQSAWNVPPLACLLALPLSHALLSSFQEWTGVCTGTLTGPWLCSPILSKPRFTVFSDNFLSEPALTFSAVFCYSGSSVGSDILGWPLPSMRITEPWAPMTLMLVDCSAALY